MMLLIEMRSFDQMRTSITIQNSEQKCSNKKYRDYRQSPNVSVKNIRQIHTIKKEVMNFFTNFSHQPKLKCTFFMVPQWDKFFLVKYNESTWMIILFSLFYFNLSFLRLLVRLCHTSFAPISWPFLHKMCYTTNIKPTKQTENLKLLFSHDSSIFHLLLLLVNYFSFCLFWLETKNLIGHFRLNGRTSHVTLNI